jgi:hypothetical protein
MASGHGLEAVHRPAGRGADLRHRHRGLVAPRGRPDLAARGRGDHRHLPLVHGRRPAAVLRPEARDREWAPPTKINRYRRENTPPYNVGKGGEGHAVQALQHALLCQQHPMETPDPGLAADDHDRMSRSRKIWRRSDAATLSPVAEAPGPGRTRASTPGRSPRAATRAGWPSTCRPPTCPGSSRSRGPLQQGRPGLDPAEGLARRALPGRDGQGDRAADQPHPELQAWVAEQAGHWKPCGSCRPRWT